MNRIYIYLFYIFTLYLLIIFQTTIFSPLNLDYIYIDFTLILVIYLSLIPDIRGGILFAFFSGFLIDLFSASSIGVYAISRVSLYLILRFILSRIYSDIFFVHIPVILFSILYEWMLISIVLKLYKVVYDMYSIGELFINISINIILGYLFFLTLRYLHARLQT